MNLMTEWKARRENIGLRYQISTLHIIKIKDYQDKKQLFYFNISCENFLPTPHVG